MVVVDDDVDAAIRDTPRLRSHAIALINLLVKDAVVPHITELTEPEEV